VVVEVSARRYTVGGGCSEIPVRNQDDGDDVAGNTSIRLDYCHTYNNVCTSSQFAQPESQGGSLVAF
jgi:hypothetical protein